MLGQLALPEDFGGYREGDKDGGGYGGGGGYSGGLINNEIFNIGVENYGLPVGGGTPNIPVTPITPPSVPVAPVAPVVIATPVINNESNNTNTNTASSSATSNNNTVAVQNTNTVTAATANANNSQTSTGANTPDATQPNVVVQWLFDNKILVGVSAVSLFIIVKKL